ncbi:MAG: CDP-diacylglycerol--serine O-phosphatidyltransferase [Nitrospirae bacterium]|nr:CDP-diacylglycerol--serine O-phosphatidyltransferase [Nitrospirota bacterium]MEC4687426.1 CDP-diacylglycerol--serine O-phosphatidyltransferase [Nitrospirota bacterium]
MRSPFLKNARWKKGVYLIPNLLTTGNLFSGLFAILAIFNANYVMAAIAILVALVFDVLDGKSARLMNSTSQFGVEYDSLADLVSFGVAPGLLIYSWALSDRGMLGSAVMFAFVAFGALRLARYNVKGANAESKYFTGLPIPAAASVLATLVIFDHHMLRMGAEVKPVLVLIITLTLAFLMVSTIKYRSFKDLKLRDGRHFNYLVWAVLTLMLVVAQPQLMLFVIAACYAVSGVVGQSMNLFGTALGKRGRPRLEADNPIGETKE